MQAFAYSGSTLSARVQNVAPFQTVMPSTQPAVLELCAQARRQIDDPLQSPTTRLLAATVLFVADHYTEDLRRRDIGDAVGTHPVYLAHLFKQRCGFNLWELVLRLRVARAGQLLVGTDLAVSEIAYASGFQSPSRFYAAFRRFTGLTPLTYRAVEQSSRG